MNVSSHDTAGGLCSEPFEYLNIVIGGMNAEAQQRSVATKFEKRVAAASGPDIRCGSPSETYLSLVTLTALESCWASTTSFLDSLGQVAAPAQLRWRAGWGSLGAGFLA